MGVTSTTDRSGPRDRAAIRTAGLVEPDSGRVTKSVIVLEGETVVELRDDVPADVPVVLDSDGYALPGFVDSHSHATIRPWEGDQMAQLRAHRTVATVRAVNNLQEDLAAGTTTMRLMGEEGYLDTNLAALERQGELRAPTLHPSGIILTPSDGHALAETATDGPDALRTRIRTNMREGATHTKFVGSGGIISDTGALRSQYSSEEVRAIIEETHRHNKPAAAHAHGGPGLKVPLETGVDSLEHATRLDDDDLAHLDGGDQFAVGTFAIFFHERGIEGEAAQQATSRLMDALEGIRTDCAETWQRVVDADVNVALGTDSVRGSMAFEVMKLVEFGATPARAIRAATLDGARLLRCSDHVGRIAPGYRCDLLVVLENPLENVSTLQEPTAVFHRGQRVA